MTVTSPAVTLQVRGDDKVLEPYRPSWPVHLRNRRPEGMGAVLAPTGTEGVNPVAGLPGTPLWARPLPLCACRAGPRREFAAIQTWAGRPR